MKNLIVICLLILPLTLSAQKNEKANFEVSGNYGTGALDEGVDVDWFAELDFSFGKTFLDDRLKLISDSIICSIEVLWG